MCTVNEDDLDTLPEIYLSTERLSSTCKKCGDDASVTLRKKDVYCVSCFMLAANHKFRASLGKSKTVRANQRVLVALSGGLASTVLLNFVHNGLSDTSHKKLRVQPVCVYINELLNEDSELYSSKCEFVFGQCKEYGLPVYISHLSSSLDIHTHIAKVNTVPEPNRELDIKFNALINSVSNETSRIDLIVKLRRSLLVKSAKQYQCDFILTGDISTSLASTMLANLALGRGAQLEDDIGFCDSRDSVKILKPIKDLSYEELTYYANIKKLSYQKDNIFHGNSIQSTIMKFVVDLQENYPATISTICKTGDKMGNSSKLTLQDHEECIICQSMLDTQEAKSSALQATEFSRIVSSTGPHHLDARLDTAAKTASSQVCKGCNCSKQQVTQRSIEKFLCYGCRLILRDIEDEDVPVYLKNAVKSRIAMAKLRSEINDFLI